MKFFDEKTISAFFILAILAFVLLGCAKAPLQSQGPKQPTTMETVGNIKSIGSMLGCMFAPNDPVCDEMRARKTDKKPHLTQEEYDKQNNKDWDKVD